MSVPLMLLGVVGGFVLIVFSAVLWPLIVVGIGLTSGFAFVLNVVRGRPGAGSTRLSAGVAAAPRYARAHLVQSVGHAALQAPIAAPHFRSPGSPPFDLHPTAGSDRRPHTARGDVGDGRAAKAA
jgi:hypothetical protein